MSDEEFCAAECSNWREASIDAAPESRDAGLISEDAFWTEADNALAHALLVGAAALATGGAAGAWGEGAAAALGAGEGAATLVGGAVGALRGAV